MKLAKATDLDEIEKMFDGLNDYLEGRLYGPEWKKDIYPTREDASQQLENGSLYVLKINQRIAGTISLSCHQEDAYKKARWNIEASADEVLVIRLLAVHPDFIKQGISAAMIDFAKSAAIKQGCKTIRLDVVNQNIPACQLYEKSGFKYVATVDLGLTYERLKWFRLYEFVI